MGFIDRLKKGVVAALNDKTTSDDLSTQIQGLGPSGPLGRKRTARDEHEIRELERGIDEKQMQIDELTLAQIIDDWKEVIELCGEVRKPIIVLRPENQTLFWRNEITTRAWRLNWQRILTSIDEFSIRHGADISDLYHRYRPSLERGMSLDRPTIAICESVFRDLDGALDAIKAQINEQMVPMRDNPNLSSNVQADPRAAEQMYQKHIQINLKLYNVEKALHGIKRVIEQSF